MFLDRIRGSCGCVGWRRWVCPRLTLRVVNPRCIAPGIHGRYIKGATNTGEWELDALNREVKG